MCSFSQVSAVVTLVEPLCGECSHPSTYQHPARSLHSSTSDSTPSLTRYEQDLLVLLTDHIRECLDLIVDITLFIDEALDLRVRIHDRRVIPTAELAAYLR